MDLSVQGHLHHSGFSGLAVDSLAEHRGPVGVAVVGAAAEHEPGVADPEELFITLTRESDAVTFGEVCVDHAEQTACGVERDE